MIVFLDFEASSLSEHSYPIEVAWVFESGQSQSMLIRPAETWTDWSPHAEAVHGISREHLTTKGLAVDLVADMMIDALSGHDLYASAPSWDGKWLSVLLRAAGRPRHLLRLGKSDAAFHAHAANILGSAVEGMDVAALVDSVIAATVPDTPVHRALFDAQLELERWRMVGDSAAAMKAGYAPL